MAHLRDYYRALQVDQSAEPEIIEAAFKRLARKYHPDMNSSARAGEKMREINEAYSVLSEPVSRKNYDLTYGDSYGGNSSDPAAGPQDTVRYPTPVWLKRLWTALGVLGIVILLRLNFRMALFVVGGWLISALIRLFLRRRRH